MTNPEIQAILDRRVQEIAHVTGAVVVSDDGIFQYMSGWPEPTGDPDKDPATARRDRGERRGALASGLKNLAQRVAATEDDDAERIIVEMKSGWCVTSRSGKCSVIALYAGKDAALGQLGYELTLLADQLGPLLDVERRAVFAPGNTW
ncbi:MULTISPECIES: roadblock/LC7 domain-containing protein [Streptomyces]|uniref:roadblock/LC7 domain-containing protein n=1 Tax=Streptomyces TaxID=1883 RepID=UPI0002E6D7C6|nr:MULTISPECIES: roadblock/LC7 domain-containing protein [unclassified Streptomyces]MDF4249565.1 roadblock/LC7 domain-containing protein [Streptomyces sp. WMMB303]